MSSGSQWKLGRFVDSLNTSTGVANQSILDLQNAANTVNNGVAVRFSNAADQAVAQVGAQISNHAAGSATGDLTFATTNSGAFGERMRITAAGNVGIGTSSPQYKLAVNGTIGTKEVIVTNTGWADYVFKPGYQLKPLNEVAAFIRENHHLPDIPSETEVKENGVSLGDMQVKLLVKIEELTIHAIEADEKNRLLQERLVRLETQIGIVNGGK